MPNTAPDPFRDSLQERFSQEGYEVVNTMETEEGDLETAFADDIARLKAEGKRTYMKMVKEPENPEPGPKPFRNRIFYVLVTPKEREKGGEPRNRHHLREDIHEELKAQGRAIYGMVDGTHDVREAFSEEMEMMRQEGLNPKIFIRDLEDPSTLMDLVNTRAIPGVTELLKAADLARSNTYYILIGDTPKRKA